MLESVLYSQHDLMNIVIAVSRIISFISIVSISQRGLPTFQEGVSNPNTTHIILGISIIASLIADTGFFIKIDRTIEVDIKIANVAEPNIVPHGDSFLVIGVPTQTVASKDI